MFLRIVSRALWVRPAKLFSSLSALTVGATLASAFLSLYFDIPGKMTTEFRALGPNLMVVPRGDAQTMPAALDARLAEEHSEVARLPWLYAIGRINDEDVILGGTELDRVARLHPSWHIAPSGPLGQEGILAGAKASAHFGWKPGEMVEVRYGDNRLSLPLLGAVSTGSSEDSQLLVPLAALQALTAQPGRLSLIQLAAPGSSSQVEAAWQSLQTAIPDAEVRPLRPVIESEARVVMKVRNLMLGLAGIVLALVMLSVLATVSGLIVDRERDIGVMKALGGSHTSIAGFFLAEMGFLALLAAAIGYAAGFGLARWIALRVFQSAVELRADVLGAVVAATLSAAMIATLFPTRWIRRADPAVILRGE
jgi:putative ABC transport system permease protein